MLVINDNRVEIGGFVQLKLVRGSTRGKDVDGRLDVAHLALEYCFRDEEQETSLFKTQNRLTSTEPW